MHSMIVIGIIGLLLFVGGCGLHPEFSLTAAGLALGVLVVGLPHGGLDQRIGSQLLRLRFSQLVSVGVFYLAYLGIAAIVIAGWFLSPMATVLVFLLMSAWHFGLEEEHRDHLNWYHWPMVVARGGMVIWVPACFQGSTVADLFNLILPTNNPDLAMALVEAIVILSPALGALVTIDLFRDLFKSRSLTLREKNCLRTTCMRVSAFALLFALVNPLISFGVYFCAWHSIRGMVHLREQFGYSSRMLAKKLLPLSGAAIGLFVVGFMASRTVNAVTPALVQTTFIGLSAVATPHLILHIIHESVGLRFEGVAE